MTPYDESIYESFLDILMPFGGYMVAVRAVAFDESGTGDEHRFMAIAGYVFEAFESAKFSRAWGAIRDKYKIPWAHMKDAGGPSGEYAHLSKSRVVEMNTEFISLIREQTLWGFSVTVDKQHYKRCVGDLPGFPSVYTFLTTCAIGRVIHWADKQGYKGQFKYVFEAGANGQAEACRVLDDIARSEEKSRRSRYQGHAFEQKGSFPPTEAADMLAWHVTKYMRDKHKGKLVARADFQALVRPKDTNSDYSESNVEEFKTAWTAVLSANDRVL